MDTIEIKGALTKILEKSQKKKYEISTLVDTASLREDLGLDSVDLLEMTWELESQFGIVIDDESLKTIRTVGDVVSTVQRISASKAATAAS